MNCRKCKRKIPNNSIYCNWCGCKQIETEYETPVPAPKQRGYLYSAQLMVDGERVNVSAPTEAEYYAKARAVKEKLLEIKKDPTKTPLGKVIDTYINDNSNVLSPSTLRAYKTARSNRFASYMDKSTSEINYQQMVNFEAKIVKPKTVANAWRLVTASLRHYGLPVPTVNLPKIPKAERPWLDYQQIKTLLKAAEGKDCELGIILGLHGLRRSELYFISAEDIDLTKGLIHVRGAVVLDAENHPVRKDTNKNATSTRDVHIVIPRLNELVEGKTGQLMTGNLNTLAAQVNRLCEANDLPRVGVHGLRHSYISLCFHLGWDALTAMQQGGYSNIQTMNEVYRHLAAQDKNEDITKMKQFFTTA